MLAKSLSRPLSPNRLIYRCIQHADCGSRVALRAVFNQQEADWINITPSLLPVTTEAGSTLSFRNDVSYQQTTDHWYTSWLPPPPFSHTLPTNYLYWMTCFKSQPYHGKYWSSEVRARHYAMVAGSGAWQQNKGLSCTTIKKHLEWLMTAGILLWDR